MFFRALLVGFLLLASSAACTTKTCTALGIAREMSFEAVLPQSVDPATTTLELCIGAVCDTSRLTTSANPNVSGWRCQDLDGHTPNFPTSCTYVDDARKLALTTNTVYGGHAGSDRLVLTAIAPSGARTELLRGTVTYEDTTDDAARGACTDAWKGTFVKE